MKNKTLLLITILITAASFAQQGINYKAVIKDDLGNVVANTLIDVRFTIEKSNGTGIYQETHNNITTNSSGLIIVSIGEGTSSDTFTDINWKNEYTLKIEIDIENDGSFLDLGSTPFKTVPYALSAADNPWVINGDNTYTTSDGVKINSSATPQEALDVNGRIKVGDISPTSPNTEGSIRYNTAKKDFEGWNGSAWLSLTKSANGWGNQSVSENNSINAEAFAYHNGTLAILSEGDISIGDIGNNGLIANGQSLFNDEEDAPKFSPFLALYNNILLVAASTTQEFGSEKYVYVYEKQNGIWSEQALISDPITNPTIPTSFGLRLDIYNNFALISDTSYNDFAGRVYLYELVSGNWNLIDVFSGSSPTSGDSFGFSISIYGSNICVSEASTGKIYLYEDSGTFGWVSAGSIDNTSGLVVDLDNDRLLVSNPANNYSSSVYEKTNGAWPSSPSYSINQGGSVVKLKDDYLLLGKDSLIRLYNFNNGTWGEIAELGSAAGLMTKLELTDDNTVITSFSSGNQDTIKYFFQN